MSEFKGFYLVCQGLGDGTMKVKYGDTRGNTNLASRYSGSSYMKETRLHGNNSKASIGKEIQKEKLDRWVQQGKAEKVGNTEWYKVSTARCFDLIANWEENTKNGYTSNDEIRNIKRQE